MDFHRLVLSKYFFSRSEGNLTVSSQSIVVEDGSEAAEPQHADGEEEDSPTGTKFTEVAASSSFSATTPR